MEWRGEEYKERLLDGYRNDLSQGGGHWLRGMHLKDILEENQEDETPDLVSEIRSGERNKSQLQNFSHCLLCWNMLGPPTKIGKVEELADFMGKNNWFGGVSIRGLLRGRCPLRNWIYSSRVIHCTISSLCDDNSLPSIWGHSLVG